MDYTAMSAQPLRRQTLVLVTDQFQCERIIKAGRAIAGITPYPAAGVPYLCRRPHQRSRCPAVPLQFGKGERVRAGNRL